jgi:hypothetical protein
MLDTIGARYKAAHPRADQLPHVWAEGGFIITRWPRSRPGRRLNSRVVQRSRLSDAECAELAEIEAAIGAWLRCGQTTGRTVLPAAPPPAAWVYRDGRVIDFAAPASWIRRRHADFVTVAMSLGQGLTVAHAVAL